MAEEFVNANLILPGTYIRVRSEGLIGVAGFSTGNIGVVGYGIRSTWDDPQPLYRRRGTGGLRQLGPGHRAHAEPHPHHR